MHDNDQRLSLAQLTVDPVSTLPFVRAAAVAGFRSVSLRLRAAPGTLAPDSGLARRDVAALKHLLGDTDVRPHMATGLWILPETDPRDFVPAIDLAAETGVECFLAVVNDENRGRALENFAATCALAASHGLDIGLEFMAYTALKSIGAAAEFLAGAHQPNAGLIVDALHLARSGGTPADVAGLDPDWIALVQLCDALRLAPPMSEFRTEARSGRRLPGEGELWLDELLDALPGNIWIDIEAPCTLPGTPDQKACRAAKATARFLQSRRRLPANA